MFDTVSSKHGWYLFKVCASHEGLSDLLIIDSQSMIDYELMIGGEVKLQGAKGFDYFITWPFLSSGFYQEGLRELRSYYERLSERKVLNPDYLESINELYDLLMTEGFDFKEVLLERRLGGSLAAPSDWLESNNKSLGDVVLLRDDCSGPVICDRV